MKDKRNILLRIAIVILVITLISTLILSSVYAKYVSNENFDTPPTARPAAFELIMETPFDDELVLNYAADGEPGAPIGFTEMVRDYDFAIRMENSEVASECCINIVFNDEVEELIQKGRTNKFSYGVSCGFELYRGTEDSNGNIVYETIILTSDILTSERYDLEIFESTGGENRNIWTAGPIVVDPQKNPDVTGHYRLRMFVYNNTLMPTPSSPVSDENLYLHHSNTEYYVLSTDGIEIEVSARQLDPAYVGIGYDA